MAGFGGVLWRRFAFCVVVSTLFGLSIPCSPSDLRLIRFEGIRGNIPRIIFEKKKPFYPARRGVALSPVLGVRVSWATLVAEVARGLSLFGGETLHL